MRRRFHRAISALFFLIVVPLPLLANDTIRLPQGIIKVTPARTAPPLRLKDDNGQAFDLSQQRGKWVFVHFWASWCGPCVREIPHIQILKNQLKDPDFLIVLINTAETEDTIFSFLSATAPQLHTLMDEDGQVSEAWAPRGLPSTYFVDPKGVIRYMALGGRPWDSAEYQNFIKALLKQAPQKIKR